MLVFSAFTPNSPLLLPEINRDQLKAVEGTRAAMQDLEHELYAAKPDVILLITEHPTTYPDAFSLPMSDPYRFDLSEFGYLDFPRTYRPDIMTIDRLQRSLRKAEMPLTLTTDEALNFASAVPLTLLTTQLPKVMIIPVNISELSPKAHFQFGQALKDIVMDSPKRIAVIAAGDMSHTLAVTAPGGFDKAGTDYDQAIQDVIRTKNTAGLLTLDAEMIAKAKEKSYRPLLVLFGLLERVSVAPHIVSYEAPLGVGLLVTNFVLS